MLKDFGSQFHLIQDTSPSSSEEPLIPTSIPPLKLVVSNPILPLQESLTSQGNKSNTGFTAKIYKRNPLEYSLVARDPFHYLDYTLTLDIHEGIDGDGVEPGTVICRFPPLSDDQLNEFIEEDETLLGMILIQFQMNIMKHLLLFCASQTASTLVIQVDDTLEGDAYGVYREIAAYADKIPTQTGNVIQLTIPAHLETIRHWEKVMEKMNQKFRQTLWEEQHENSIIRNYLKSQVLITN